MKLAIITADYVELQPKTYKGCYFEIDDFKSDLINTGDFDLDCRIARQFAYNNGADTVMFSSSVDGY